MSSTKRVQLDFPHELLLYSSIKPATTNAFPSSINSPLYRNSVADFRPFSHRPSPPHLSFPSPPPPSSTSTMAEPDVDLDSIIDRLLEGKPISLPPLLHPHSSFYQPVARKGDLSGSREIEPDLRLLLAPNDLPPPPPPGSLF